MITVNFVIGVYKFIWVCFMLLNLCTNKCNPKIKLT